MGTVAAFARQSRPTPSDETGSGRSFSDNVAQLLDRIDCRLVKSDEQLEAIFRLRYQAYMRDGGILANSCGTFSDPYDERGKVYLFGLYIDDELASSIRIHVVAKGHPECPSLEAFPDILQPEIDAGNVMIDSTRFVTDERLARIHRALPYATLRLSGMAAGYFKADYILAAIRAEHQAFYRRVFRYRLVCEPRPYPLLAKPICLMMAHYPRFREEVHRRYPFFRSTFTERQMLFKHSRFRAPPIGETALPQECASPSPNSANNTRTGDEAAPACHGC